jgi:hypothetical protein
MRSIDNLKELFVPDFNSLSATTIRDFEAADEIQQLHQTIRKEIPKGNWEAIRKEIFRQMIDLLDIPLPPVFLDAWQQQQEVRRELIRQQDKMLLDADGGENANNSDISAVISLTDHEIRTTHSPSLTLKMGNHETGETPVAIGKIRLFIGVKFHLQDVTLKIENGKITEVLSGQATGHGVMQYQNATLLEQEFLKFDLPQKLQPEKHETQEERDSTTQKEHIMPMEEFAPLPPNQPEKTTHSPMRANLMQFLLGLGVALLATMLFWIMR